VAIALTSDYGGLAIRGVDGWSGRAGAHSQSARLIIIIASASRSSRSASAAQGLR